MTVPLTVTGLVADGEVDGAVGTGLLQLAQDDDPPSELVGQRTLGLQGATESVYLPAPVTCSENSPFGPVVVETTKVAPGVSFYDDVDAGDGIIGRHRRGDRKRQRKSHQRNTREIRIMISPVKDAPPFWQRQVL